MDEETKQLIDYLVDGYYRDAYLIGTEEEIMEYLGYKDFKPFSKPEVDEEEEFDEWLI